MQTKSYDYESAAVGSLPSDFTNVNLNGEMGNYQVGTAGAVGGAHAFVDVSASGPGGGGFLYTGQAVQANMAIQFDQVVNLDSNQHGAQAGVVFRSDDTGNNFYVCLYDYKYKSGNLYKKVNGSIGGMGGITFTPPSPDPVNGTQMSTHVDDTAAGVTKIWLWPAGTTMPTTPNCQFTDSTNPLPAGRVGVYSMANNTSMGSTLPSVDNLFVGDAGTAFSAAAPASTVTFSPSSAACYLSPLNWDDDGSGNKQANGARPGSTTAWSVPPGAEFRFGWNTPATSGNVAKLNIDVSFLNAASVAANQYPVLAYHVNDGPLLTTQLASGTGGLFAIDLTAAGVSGAGTYQVRGLILRQSLNYSRWAATTGVVPDLAVKIANLTVDAGSTAVAPAVLSKRLIVFGDSITEGVRSLGQAVDFTAADSTLAYCRALAFGLGAELGAIGYGAQGWEKTGSGGVPTFPNAWQLYSAGRNRDFTPAVDFVACIHGANDGLNNVADSSVTADALAWLTAARAKFGSAAKLLLCVPFGGFKRAALAAAFQQYQQATPDASAFLLDGGTSLQAGLTGFVTGGTWASPADGVHPAAATHARAATILTEQVQAALDAAAGSSSSSGSGLPAAQLSTLNAIAAAVAAIQAVTDPVHAGFAAAGVADLAVWTEFGAAEVSNSIPSALNTQLQMLLVNALAGIVLPAVTTGSALDKLLATLTAALAAQTAAAGAQAAAQTASTSAGTAATAATAAQTATAGLSGSLATIQTAAAGAQTAAQAASTQAQTAATQATTAATAASAAQTAATGLAGSLGSIQAAATAASTSAGTAATQATTAATAATGLAGSLGSIQAAATTAATQATTAATAAGSALAAAQTANTNAIAATTAATTAAAQATAAQAAAAAAATAAASSATVLGDLAAQTAAAAPAMGVVAASPAPTTTTFSATGFNPAVLSTLYAGQYVYFTSPALAGGGRKIASMTAFNGKVTITVVATPNPLPAAPVPGETITIE